MWRALGVSRSSSWHAGHQSEAPLAKISHVEKKRAAGTSLRWCLEELSRHVSECKEDREQDRAKIHYLQDELSLLSARSQSTPRRFMTNSASSVVRFPVRWDATVPPSQWRTWCGWRFGAASFRETSICGTCLPREKTMTPSGQSSPAASSPDCVKEYARRLVRRVSAFRQC